MTIGNVIAILGIAVVAFMAYRILEALKAMNAEKKEDQAFVMLQRQLMEVQSSLKEQDKTLQSGLKNQDRTLQEQLNRSQESLQKQFATTSKIIKEVTEKMTKLDETNKQVVNFAEQMKSLENILKNPKQRGVLGEFFLESQLSSVLPPASYRMQYSFSNGEIVDAAVFVQEKIIPIDAKFSLENYNRVMEETDGVLRDKKEKEFKADLKKRIDETSKYVRPNENTTDFAFMFIPADGVFYNLLVQKVGSVEVNTQDLIQYAFGKRVILVSPMTFYAYLQTILHALKSLQIEESAREIQKRVGDLGRHMNAYQDYMIKLGGHLNTTVSSYQNAGKEFNKIDKDVMKITAGEVSIGVDLPEVDRPKSFKPDATVNVKVSSTTKPPQFI